MQWTVIRRELAAKAGLSIPRNIHFSAFRRSTQEKIAAAQRLPNAAPTGRVFAYFDLLHPAVFMVWNNGGEGDFFDLGPVLVAVPAGASRVSLFPGSVFPAAPWGEGGGQELRRVDTRRRLGQVFGEKTTAAKAAAGMPGSFVVKQEPAVALP